MFRRSIGALLDIALVGLIAVVVLTAAVGPVAALSGRTPLVIGGGSMAPAIPKGSIVLVEPSVGPAIEAGDVATFRTPENVLVTHRVVRVVQRTDGTWYETKGDANRYPDPALWPASSVVGPVVASVPGLGFMSWLLRHPTGWLNVAVLAVWLLVARHLVPAPVSFPSGVSSRAHRRGSGAAAGANGADTGSLAPEASR